jgi:hypothetical protein
MKVLKTFISIHNTDIIKKSINHTKPSKPNCCGWYCSNNKKFHQASPTKLTAVKISFKQLVCHRRLGQSLNHFGCLASTQIRSKVEDFSISYDVGSLQETMMQSIPTGDSDSLQVNNLKHLSMGEKTLAITQV